MFSQEEIDAGAVQLTNNKLKPRDVRLLRSVFLIYLKNRAASFSDLKQRLETVVDANGDVQASELAALALLFRDNGFSLSDLKGGRSSLQTDKKGEFIFKIQYGLTLLDYELPEFFSGELEGEDKSSSGGIYVSYTPGKETDICD